MRPVCLLVLAWISLALVPASAQGRLVASQAIPVPDMMKMLSGDTMVGSEAQNATPGQIAKLIDSLGVGSGLFGSCTPGMSACDNAAITLVKIGPPAVEPLIRAVQQIQPSQASENRRAFAVQILGHIQDRRAVTALMACLEKDPSGFVRVFAPPALERIGDPVAEKSLLAALKDRYPDIQAGAAHALGTLHSVAAIPDLIPLLAAPSTRPAFSTGGLGGPDSCSPARTVGWALGSIGAPALQPLRKALAGTDPQVHRCAALGLACNASAEVNADLRDLLRDADSDVRISAALSEYNRHDPLALPLMAALLHDASQKVRWNAMYSLVQTRGIPELKTLIEVANGADPIAADNAAEGIRSLWTPGAVDLLLEVVQHGKDRARVCAAEALLESNDPRVATPVLSLFEDPNPEVRVGVIYLAARIHDPRTFPALVHASEDPNEKVRCCATSMLSMFKAEGAVAPLIKRLQDSSEQVRLYAVYGLGFKGDREAIAPLQALIPTAGPRVRTAAEKALEIIDGKRSTF